MKCLKWQKVTLQLTWMSFLQNCEVCFNQERLPITYHNFRHKSLVRPKSKFPNWQGSQLICYKAKFSQSHNIYLADLKYNITYQNIQGKLRSGRFLNRKVCFNQESFPITYHNFRHKSLVTPKSKLYLLYINLIYTLNDQKITNIHFATYMGGFLVEL